MNKILLTILGIIVVIVSVVIFVEILTTLLGIVIYLSILIIVIGGAFLILRQIFKR